MSQSEDEMNLIRTIKETIEGDGKKNQKRVPKGPVAKQTFCFQNENGASWEQDYQYVSIATCNSPVI